MRKPRALNGPHIKRDMPAYRIVMHFGSLAAFCGATEFAPATVYGWLSRGYVPLVHVRRIMTAADEAGKPLTREAFVPEVAQW